jgi:hypothetical protein
LRQKTCPTLAFEVPAQVWRCASLERRNESEQGESRQGWPAATSICSLFVLYLFYSRFPTQEEPMPVTIAPTAALDALVLSGDISRIIPLPAERSGGSHFIAVSDGSLLEASFANGPGERFKIIKDGAGIVILSEDRAEVQWPIEWLTVAGMNQALTIEHQPEPLPLFPEAA